MHYLESIFKVLVVGLILGAGLPALFATGMLAYSFGAGGEEADHIVHKPNPARLQRLRRHPRARDPQHQSCAAQVAQICP